MKNYFTPIKTNATAATLITMPINTIIRYSLTLGKITEGNIQLRTTIHQCFADFLECPKLFLYDLSVLL